MAINMQKRTKYSTYSAQVLVVASTLTCEEAIRFLCIALLAVCNLVVVCASCPFCEVYGKRVDDVGA